MDRKSPTPIYRVCLVGFGYRGRYLLQLLQQLPSVQVVGIADPQATESPGGEISLYNRGDQDYRRMIEHERPDLVVIASPWQCHTEQALYCAKAGIHIALEIRGGTSWEDYTPLLEVAEVAGVRIYPLENTVFMREVMAIGQMIEQGVFGEILYLRGGYRHDLRHLLVSPSGELGGEGAEAAWRVRYYLEQEADLYPTHGFAPLALWARLRREEEIKRLEALASSSRGLAAYLDRYAIEGQRPSILTPDIVTTQIETDRGILISLIHDTTLPRPKSLDYEVQGTKGIWNADRRALYLEGMSPEGAWQTDEPYLQHYLHPLWRAWGEEALRIDQHHQGMDYMMLRTLLEDLAHPGLYPTDLNDLALWSSITPRSAASLARGKLRN